MYSHPWKPTRSLKKGHFERKGLSSNRDILAFWGPFTKQKPQVSGQPFLQFKSNGKNIKHIFFRFLNVISKKKYSFSIKKKYAF